MTHAPWFEQFCCVEFDAWGKAKKQCLSVRPSGLDRIECLGCDKTHKHCSGPGMFRAVCPSVRPSGLDRIGQD